jgi:DNA invertase Pin-like site-specific DNA recombinase
MRCKLIGYLRVSTVKQGQSGLGLEAQAAAIRAHVMARGCDLVASYTEVESGKRDARPELLKALAHARRIGATLVISKMDRLSRNLAFLANLMESGVDFIACDNPQANRLTLGVLAVFAEDEARRISTRTKEALAAYKARGGKLGTDNLTAEGRMKGTTASVQANRAKAVEAYSDLVPMMIAGRDEGLSLAKIAERLNADGHTTRTGRPWTYIQVMRCLARV